MWPYITSEARESQGMVDACGHSIALASFTLPQDNVKTIQISLHYVAGVIGGGFFKSIIYSHGVKRNPTEVLVIRQWVTNHHNIKKSQHLREPSTCSIFYQCNFLGLTSGVQLQLS